MLYIPKKRPEKQGIYIMTNYTDLTDDMFERMNRPDSGDVRVDLLISEYPDHFAYFLSRLPPERSLFWRAMSAQFYHFGDRQDVLTGAFAYPNPSHILTSTATPSATLSDMVPHLGRLSPGRAEGWALPDHISTSDQFLQVAGSAGVADDSTQAMTEQFLLCLVRRGYNTAHMDDAAQYQMAHRVTRMLNILRSVETDLTSDRIKSVWDTLFRHRRAGFAHIGSRSLLAYKWLTTVVGVNQQLRPLRGLENRRISDHHGWLTGTSRLWEALRSDPFMAIAAYRELFLYRPPLRSTNETRQILGADIWTALAKGIRTRHGPVLSRHSEDQPKPTLFGPMSKAILGAVCMREPWAKTLSFESYIDSRQAAGLSPHYQLHAFCMMQWMLHEHGRTTLLPIRNAEREPAHTWLRESTYDAQGKYAQGVSIGDRMRQWTVLAANAPETIDPNEMQVTRLCAALLVESLVHTSSSNRGGAWVLSRTFREMWKGLRAGTRNIPAHMPTIAARLGNDVFGPGMEKALPSHSEHRATWTDAVLGAATLALPIVKGADK